MFNIWGVLEPNASSPNKMRQMLIKISFAIWSGRQIEKSALICRRRLFHRQQFPTLHIFEFMSSKGTKKIPKKRRVITTSQKKQHTTTNHYPLNILLF